MPITFVRVAVSLVSSNVNYEGSSNKFQMFAMSSATSAWPSYEELEDERREAIIFLENCLDQIGNSNKKAFSTLIFAFFTIKYFQARDFLNYWKDFADASDTKTKFMV
jgi:hypothetical protein